MPPYTMTDTAAEPACSCGRPLDQLYVVEREGRGSEGYYQTIDLTCWCGRTHDEDDVTAQYDALEVTQTAEMV